MDLTRGKMLAIIKSTTAAAELARGIAKELRKRKMIRETAVAAPGSAGFGTVALIGGTLLKLGRCARFGINLAPIVTIYSTTHRC